MPKPTDYSKLSDDELFRQLEHAAIQEHEAFEAYATDPNWQVRQHHWADEEAAAGEEIVRRGLERKYIDLLHADHPRIRLRAALSARDFAPDLALAVLEELDDAARYGGHIAVTAGATLDAMRKRRSIAPEKAE